MKSEDIDKNISLINRRLNAHNDHVTKIISMFEKTTTALEKHTKEIDFIADELIDMQKRINESLMIANNYERKQMTLEKRLKDILENLEK